MVFKEKISKGFIALAIFDLIITQLIFNNWIITTLSIGYILAIFVYNYISNKNIVYIIENDELIINNPNTMQRIKIKDIRYIQVNGYFRVTWPFKDRPPYELFYNYSCVNDMNNENIEVFKSKGYFVNSIPVNKSIKNTLNQNIIDVLRNQYHIKSDSIVFMDSHKNE